MIIDSQAFEHLELLEVTNSITKSKIGSLFNWLNHTTTAFGCRLLKQWLCAPLLDVDKINERLDAVEDLRNNRVLIDI